MNQRGLFQTVELQHCNIEPQTTVRLGTRSAQVSLRKRRKEATEKLKAILAELEGKDILVSQYCDYWWYSGLRLGRLQVEWSSSGGELPNVVALWGTRGATVRIFLDRLYQLREQYHNSGKPYYLLDFWNGFGQSPLEQCRRGGYQCLHIQQAK
jgi:hypothetical protein